MPGAQYLYTGRTFERDGYDAHWRAIYDDKGSIIVAICHNMDLGDAWEHADDPGYPLPMTAFAYQLGVNYVLARFAFGDLSLEESLHSVDLFAKAVMPGLAAAQAS